MDTWHSFIMSKQGWSLSCLYYGGKNVMYHDAVAQIHYYIYLYHKNILFLKLLSWINENPFRSFRDKM